MFWSDTANVKRAYPGAPNASPGTTATLASSSSSAASSMVLCGVFPAISLAGGESVVVPTTEETEFRVTVEQLDAARTARTKALFFVSPGNPSGTVYPPAEVKAIGRWALENGIWVIADEIYEHLTYGKHRFTSMPGVVPEVAGSTLIVNGVAKT